MANGKTQTERSTLSLMSHKRSRDGLNPGHLAFCPGLSYATLFFVLFCFFDGCYCYKNRLSLVSSENLKEPQRRRGLGKWVNSCPKHSVYGTNTCRFVYLPRQSKVPYKSKVWLLLKIAFSTLQNHMASIPQDTYQTDLLLSISQSAFAENPSGSQNPGRR